MALQMMLRVPLLNTALCLLINKSERERDTHMNRDRNKNHRQWLNKYTIIYTLIRTKPKICLLMEIQWISANL